MIASSRVRPSQYSSKRIQTGKRSLQQCPTKLVIIIYIALRKDTIVDREPLRVVRPSALDTRNGDGKHFMHCSKPV